MKRKVSRRDSTKRSGARREREGAGLAAVRSSRKAPLALQYKVAELSTVDETSIEATVNEWVGRGWHLEGIHFAMRESSKRPAMAFVLFTRAGEEIADARDAVADAAQPSAIPLPHASTPSSDPWRRLREL